LAVVNNATAQPSIDGGRAAPESETGRLGESGVARSDVVMGWVSPWVRLGWVELSGIWAGDCMTQFHLNSLPDLRRAGSIRSSL